MTRSEIEHGIEKMVQSSRVSAKLQTAGLPLPSKPASTESRINIFEEWETLKKSYGGVGNIPFEDLGNYLDKWTELVSYARWTEAIADIRQTTSKEIRDTVEKQLYTIQDGGRELRAASVQTEPIYIEWENKYIEDNTYYTSIKGLREAYEYRANAISREITRRASEVDSVRRSYNRGGAV